MSWGVISIFVSFLAFAVAAYFYNWVVKLPSNNKTIDEVGKLIRKGSFTFLKKEYKILAIFIMVVSVLILLFFPTPVWKQESIFANLPMVLSFILGSVLSGLAGVIGISIATIANVKTAVMAKESLEKSFLAGFRRRRSNGNGSCWNIFAWCSCILPYNK